MLEWLLAGALAGYAIAIPVGAIAVLIVELGIRRGFAIGAAAGLGAATADGLYATLAVVGGAVVAEALLPFEGILRIVAAGALVGVALRGLLLMLLGPRGAPSSSRLPDGPIGTYARFVVITLLNPATVIYFVALILGQPRLAADPAGRAAFVVGAFGASASWQLLLAGVGAIGHHRLPTRFQQAVSLLGFGLILFFAIGIAAGP